MQTARDEVFNLLLQVEETLEKNARMDAKTRDEWVAAGDKDYVKAFDEILYKLGELQEAVGYYVDE